MSPGSGKMDPLPLDDPVADGIRRLPGLPAARRAAMRAELDALAAEILPPPPGSPSWPLPPATTLLVGLTVVGLGAWLLLALSSLQATGVPGSPSAAGTMRPEAAVDSGGRASSAATDWPAGLRTASATPRVTATASRVAPPRSPTPARVDLAMTPAPPGAADERRESSAQRTATPHPAGRSTPDPHEFERPPPGGGAYPGPPGPNDQGVVSGRVTDDSGQPLSGAKVTLFSIAGPAASAEQLTDDNGRFSLLVGPGVYDVRAEAAGFREQWFDGRASRDEADSIVVEPGGGRDGVSFALAPLSSPVPPGYPGPP